MLNYWYWLVLFTTLFLKNYYQYVSGYTIHRHGSIGIRECGGIQQRLYNPHQSLSSSLSSSSSLQSSIEDQSSEAIKSLEFHVGQWKGSAISFAITNDVAAGAIRRNISRQYTTSVELIAQQQRFQETIQFDHDHDDDNKEEAVKCAMVDFRKCQMDVDSVDASYSLDHTTMKSTSTSTKNNNKMEDCHLVLNLLPETLEGVNAIGFCVEHCLVTGDHSRSRSFVVYDSNQQLARIVVCQEERICIISPDNTEDPNDNDRRLARSTNVQQDQPPQHSPSSLVSSSKTMTTTTTTTITTTDTDKNKALILTTANLLELSSGVWLGDAVIRDNLSVLMSPLLEKKGFGGNNNPQVHAATLIPFASWSVVGVQKIAWRWLWDFGEEIRQMVQVGKMLGSGMLLATDQFNLVGTVITNESLSRRIAKPERIVFVDWENDMVGFLVGSVGIQVPRQSRFDHTRRIRPFYTDVRVYQTTRDGTTKICSQLTRLYGYDGRLKQGCSAFYTHQETEPTTTTTSDEEEDQSTTIVTNDEDETFQ